MNDSVERPPYLWAGFVFQSLGIATPFQVGAGLVVIAMVVALRIPAPRIRPTAPMAEPVDEVASIRA